MKTTFTAAAGVLALATMASAQSRCAIECFQSVVTEHPPLDCTEANMYLCFCKGQDLQNYFLECAYDKCADNADAAVQFGVGLCAELGAPITVPARPSTTAAAAATSTPAAPVEEPTTTTEAPPAVETTSAAAPVATSAPADEGSESVASSEPSPSSEDSYPVPSADAEESTTTVEEPTASGNGTVTPSAVPAGAAFSGASGLVAAGVAVLAAAQLL